MGLAPMWLCSVDMLREYENHPKVLEGIRNKRFMCLRSERLTFYVYRGVEKDYIVVPCRFCSCYDFLLTVLIRRRRCACYHVIGLEIARLWGALLDVRVEDRELVEVLEEVLVYGKSARLRKYV